MSEGRFSSYDEPMKNVNTVPMPESGGNELDILRRMTRRIRQIDEQIEQLRDERRELSDHSVHVSKDVSSQLDANARTVSGEYEQVKEV